MVEVVEYIESMTGFNIEPWVILSSSVIFRIPIQTGKSVATCSMVVNNIKEYCDATLVAFVNKSLVHLRSTVGFIKCKIEGWIVPPTVIAFKLLYGH